MILNSIYIYMRISYVHVYIYMISSMFVAVFIPVHWYWYFIGNCGSIYGFCGMNKKNSEIMVMVVDLVLWSPVSNLVSNGAPFWNVKNKQTKELFVVTKGFLKQMWPFLLAVMEWRLHSATLPHLPLHVIARTKSQSDYCLMVSRIDTKINGSVGIPTLDDVDVFINEIIDLRCGQLEDHYIYISFTEYRYPMKMNSWVDNHQPL